MTKIIDDIRKSISNENVVNALRVAARDILPVVANRIFTDGIDSNGSLIGQYATKPIYISKKASPRAAGRPTKKSYFFPGGYREFKTAIGRGDKVNLKVFGRLQSDYLTSKEAVSGTRITYSLKETDNINKKDYAEEHFKTDIFSLTKGEENTIKKTFQFELLRNLSR